MQATRLTLVCHAVTPMQKQGRFPDDESLLMDWQNARLSLTDRFRKSVRLICGPEARTRQTATLFGDHAVVEPALRDGDFGHWKGQDTAQLDRDELMTWLTDSASAPMAASRWTTFARAWANG